MKWSKLILSIIISQLAGLIGAFFTTPSIHTWYATLVKPSFNPPNWVFGPVWTILYTLIGISLYLVIKDGIGSKEKKFALIVFSIHLILNSLWSILFFGMKNPFLAFIEILILWGLIFYTMLLFKRIDQKTVYLLTPYLLWVSFAAILNFSIWRLN
jgi:tryptophan-rich sensory protein